MFGKSHEYDEAGSELGVSRRTFIAMGCTVLFGSMMFSGNCHAEGITNDLVSHSGQDSGKSSSSASASSSSSSTASVQVKASVEDYTWDELAAIADEISASGSDKAALEVAEKYNLCASDGMLDGTQTKSITLSDGTETSVQIIGIYHDDKSDDTGKAGLTFLFTDPVGEQSMNSDASNSEGWEMSELRTWLNEDFIAELPNDLAKDVVQVEKLTNNTGLDADVDSVTATTDKVWLLSTTELCGEITWWGDASDDVLNAEGSQYELYKDLNIGNNASNDIMVRTIDGTPSIWWLRSSYLGDDQKFYVANDGTGERNRDDADDEIAVVPAFCIGLGGVSGTAATGSADSGSASAAGSLAWIEGSYSDVRGGNTEDHGYFDSFDISSVDSDAMTAIVTWSWTSAQVGYYSFPAGGVENAELTVLDDGSVQFETGRAYKSMFEYPVNAFSVVGTITSDGKIVINGKMVYEVDTLLESDVLTGNITDVVFSKDEK